MKHLEASRCATVTITESSSQQADNKDQHEDVLIHRVLRSLSLIRGNLLCTIVVVKFVTVCTYSSLITLSSHAQKN